MLSGRELVLPQWARSNRQLFEGTLPIFANDATRCPSRELPSHDLSAFVVEFDCVGSMPEFARRTSARDGVRLVGMGMLIQREAG